MSDYDTSGDDTDRGTHDAGLDTPAPNGSEPSGQGSDTRRDGLDQDSGDSPEPFDSPDHADPSHPSPAPRQGFQPPQVPGAQPGREQEPGPVDWQSRYGHLQSHTDREMARMRQEMAQRDQELARYREEQERQRQLAQLPFYSKRHPEYDKWHALRTRVEAFGAVETRIKSNSKLTPEAKQEAIAAAAEAQGVTDQDLERYAEAQKGMRERWHTLQEAPEEIIIPLAEQAAAAFFRRQEEQQRAVQQVDQVFANPQFQPILQEYRPAIEDMVQNRGVPWDVAWRLVHTDAYMRQQETRYQARLRELEQQLENLQAGQQTRTRQARAGMPQSVQGVSAMDPLRLAQKEAKEQGIPTDPSNRRFQQLLRKHEAAVRRESS